jgi:uncharacterized cupin superfamily protein
MPKIDVDSAPTRLGASYPPPYDEPCKARLRFKLGDAGGLTQFGVNLLRLPAGQWSSQRHWHTAEDEFVWVVEGEVVLVTDAGEQALRAGDCAAFPAGLADGHHIQNRSGREAVLLEIGSRAPDRDGCGYSDIDLFVDAGSLIYRHRDGRPYDEDIPGRTR